MRKREQREIIAVNLKDLLKSRKITAKQVAKDLNVSYSTFGDWTRARTLPSPNPLKDVADYSSNSRRGCRPVIVISKSLF